MAINILILLDNLMYYSFRRLIFSRFYIGLTDKKIAAKHKHI
jgi:hypothetical protein